MNEPLTSSLSAMLDDICDALLQIVDRPLTLFGHSMGAFVGYELTHQLLTKTALRPARLIVSSQFAPNAMPNLGVHQYDDRAVINMITSLGGVAGGLPPDPELAAFIADVVRADFRMIETSTPTEAPLHIPLNAFGGDSDPLVKTTHLHAWSDYTTADFDVTVFAGNHFYLQNQRSQTVSAVAALMETSTFDSRRD